MKTQNQQASAHHRIYTKVSFVVSLLSVSSLPFLKEGKANLEYCVKGPDLYTAD